MISGSNSAKLLTSSLIVNFLLMLLLRDLAGDPLRLQRNHLHAAIAFALFEVFDYRPKILLKTGGMFFAYLSNFLYNRTFHACSHFNSIIIALPIPRSSDSVCVRSPLLNRISNAL